MAGVPTPPPTAAGWIATVPDLITTDADHDGTRTTFHTLPTQSGCRAITWADRSYHHSPTGRHNASARGAASITLASITQKCTSTTLELSFRLDVGRLLTLALHRSVAR